ncbi:MAG TPA: YfhO family protein [bacterium]|nr:YfhO family protein [bacterium]
MKTATVRRVAPFVFFGALVVLFFPKLISLAYLPAAKDTLTFSYPAQLELGRALRGGYFPLWSTHLNSPLFAEGQGAFAHPLALSLFALLPPVAASNLFLLVHVYAGLAFTYLLCRDLGQSRLAATLAAPAFALSAFFLARLGIYTIVTNGVWLPALLWLGGRFARTGDLRYALGGAMGGALALLAGQFQLASYAVVAAAAYAAVYSRPRKNAAAAILCFGAVPLALAAVQLLPTYELWRLSERAANTRAGEYSFWPPQFLQLVLPDLFGRSPHPAFAPLGGAQVDNYWGRSSFVESAFYVGIFPLLLAAVGVAKKRRWFFVVLGILAAAFACGIYTPLFNLYKYVPPFGFFRAPSRLLLYATFALAVFAGDGLDYFVRSRSRAYVATALGVTLAAAALVLTFRFTLPQFKNAIEKTAAAKAEVAASRYKNVEAVREYYADKSRTIFRRAANSSRLRNRATWFQFAVLGAAVVVFWGARRNRAVAAAAPYVFIIITAADLYRFGSGLNPTVPAALVNKPPPVAAAFYRAADVRVYSSGFSLGPNKQLGLGLIHENTHAIWGYDLLVPRASLRPSYAARVFEKLEDLYTTVPEPGGGRFPTPTATDAKIFGAYGIKYFVRLTPWRGGGIAPVAHVPPYYVYANVLAAPRARAVTGYLLAEDDDAALELMRGDGFEPAREAVLAAAPEGFEPAETPGAPVLLERRTPLAFRCRLEGPSLLLLDELFYPGWEAKVDGRPAKIYRANVISRAVVVPPGRHTVAFDYRPKYFYVGLAISLLAWVAALAGITVQTLRRLKYARVEKT